MVPGAFVEVHVLFAPRFLDDALGFAAEMAAVDAEFAIRAREDTAAGAAMSQHDAVGVGELNAAFGLGIIGRSDRDGAGVVHAEAPLGDVIMMRAHVGVAAAGVFAILAPGREMVVH